MTAAEWVETILLCETEPHPERMVPPLSVAPSWHALHGLEVAGTTVLLTDPLVLAARWEWLAYAAHYLVLPHRAEFARIARLQAESLLEEAVV